MAGGEENKNGNNQSFTMLFLIIFTVLIAAVLLMKSEQPRSRDDRASPAYAPRARDDDITRTRKSTTNMYLPRARGDDNRAADFLPGLQKTAENQPANEGKRQSIDTNQPIEKTSLRPSNIDKGRRISQATRGSRVEVDCAENTSLERFWLVFDSMTSTLTEYWQKSFAARFSQVSVNDSVDLFIKMNMNTWLYGKTDIPGTEIADFYQRQLVKNKNLICDYNAVCSSILLYTLYNKDWQTFRHLISNTSVLSHLPDKITQFWAKAVYSACRRGEAGVVSQQRVNDVVNLIRHSIAFEFATEMRLSEDDRMITTQKVNKTIHDQRLACLLRILLRYWQYEAIVKVHGECCQSVWKTYRGILASTFFLIIQEKLTVSRLKMIHPHLWMILADIVKNFPQVVFSGAVAKTISSLIEAMSTKLVTLNDELQHHIRDKRYDSTEVSDILLGCFSSSGQATSSAFCNALFGNQNRVANTALQTHVTSDEAAKIFLKKYATRLALGQPFLHNRKAIIADSIMYYKFVVRAKKAWPDGDVLFTLNLLDKPLATLRSRMGETHGMINVLAHDKRIAVLATGQCRMAYLESHRALLARQVLTKQIDYSRMATTAKLIANFNVVSALMCYEQPVLKNTVMVSLANTYDPKITELNENRYVFIRANTLTRFASAFPPTLLVGFDDNPFIGKLKHLTKTEGMDWLGWSHLYAMGEWLLGRACEFLSDRWNTFAKGKTNYVRIESDDEKLILLWQFIKLHMITELYTEYQLIFGSLLYCDDKVLAGQSQDRVKVLLTKSKLTLVRLVCINYLLHQWSTANNPDNPDLSAADMMTASEKTILETFGLRHEGVAALLRRRDINLLQDFYKCYPNDSDNLRQFATSELHKRFTGMLTSPKDEMVAMQLVPLYGYSGVFAMESLAVELEDGSSAAVLLYNGGAKFSIPIKDACASGRLIDGKTGTCLLALQVLSTDAQFVSLVITAVNITPETIKGMKNKEKTEYNVEIQIGHRMIPLGSGVKRSIVSFSSRPMTTSEDNRLYTAMMNLSDDHDMTLIPLGSSISAVNCSMRRRIPLSSLADQAYYEVPSLDEMALSHDENQSANDTSLLPVSADQVLSSSLSPPLPLQHKDNGRDGIYFLLNGERFSLPV